MRLLLNNSDLKPVIILGAGGHAKVISEALNRSGTEILGFVAPDKNPGTLFMGRKILGDDQFINTFSPDDVLLANGIGALPGNKLRWLLAERMRRQGYSFISIFHPSAIIAMDVKFAEGVQVMAGAVIQPGTQVGRDSIINTGVLLDHDCKISENCHLAPGVVCSGNVKVGTGVHIGTGTSVIQNITIEKNAVVASGSVVYKDIANDMTFMQLHQINLIKKKG